MGFALLTLSLAQLLDLATFIPMTARHGVSIEANPLVEAIRMDLGLGGVIAVKVALLVLVASTVVIIQRRGPGTAPSGTAGLVVRFGILAGLFGAVTNTMTLA